MHSLAPTLVIYPRGEPAVESLCVELGNRVPLICLSGERLHDRRIPYATELQAVAEVKTTPLVPFGLPWRKGVHGWLLRHLKPRIGTLVLTRPDQLPLRAVFPKARTIYYVLDDYRAYNRPWWSVQEHKLLAAADQVVTVSTAAAALLLERNPSARVTVSRNAVPADWIPPAPPDHPRPLPCGAMLPRPVAGVIGRISSRLRLDWLSTAIERTPWLHWLFVGDPERAELIPADRPVLAWLRRHPRCLFVGRQPYHSLPDYAAAVDIAVLPYSERSTNPSGSPMRLFLHLPYAAPLLVTPGCLQVEEFSEAVTMCRTAEELTEQLCRLRAAGPSPESRRLRWQIARANTWAVRADGFAKLIRAEADRAC